MRIPTIHGIIERRILANYTADPEYVQKYYQNLSDLNYTMGKL